MADLFDKSGGYRRLHSFTFATMIHLGTIRFCKNFIPYQEDPLGKTSGQMIGAARSGRQNIIEGSERASTSKETEIKLTDVARASLGELLGDYEIFLAERGVLPWSRQDPERQRLVSLRLPSFEYSEDSLHDYWRYFQEVSRMYARWLESKDPCTVAQAMLVLISQAMNMLKAQLAQLGQRFLEQGGFREKMSQCRNESRSQGQPSAPCCPLCQGAMRSRQDRQGRNFWGCCAYPVCKGTQQST